MTFDCKIKFTSHVDHGKITMGEGFENLSQRTYEHRFTATGNKEKIFSLEGLSPGLEKGIELNSIEIDGFRLPDAEKSTQFKMKGNPHVDNVSIEEKDFRFNGDLELDIDRTRLFWFPHHYSKRKIDFVYNNNLHTCNRGEGCWEGEEGEHREEFINAPFDRSLSPKQGDHFSLGCSQTYGTAVDKNRVWPALLGYHNFGSPGAGVDSIFYNAHRIVELFKPKAMIIVFPNLNRRLLEFQRGGYFFRIPCIINGLGELYENDHYWIDSISLKEMFFELRNQMIVDNDNRYSRNFMKRISDLPCDIQVSSYDHETYQILPKYFKNVLPFFGKIDLALDGKHYGPLSHEKWVEEIKNHNI